MANAERQRGSVTIEMVILFPVVLGLLFAAVMAPDDDEAEQSEEETKNVETKEAAATA